MYYYISMLTWILVHGNYTQFPATQQMWHWWLQRVVMAKDFSRRLVKREIELPSFKVFAWYNSYYWMCIFLVRIGSASWLVMSCYFQLIEFPSWVCHWFCVGHKDFVSSLDFNYDGQFLASGCFHGIVQVWDASRNLKNVFEGLGGGIEVRLLIFLLFCFK